MVEETCLLLLLFTRAGVITGGSPPPGDKWRRMWVGVGPDFVCTSIHSIECMDGEGRED